jgi:osmotically-inducible protein OsmY
MDKMTDVALQNEIRKNLNSDPAINPARIGVGVINGIAMLSGCVSSQEEKLAVEKAAASVDGVNAWVEEIEIRSSVSNTDLEMAIRAKEIIARHLGENQERIRIKVERGRVTLAGRVEHQYEKIAAEIFLRKLVGVKGITSHIDVAAAPPSAQAGVASQSS